MGGQTDTRPQRDQQPVSQGQAQASSHRPGEWLILIQGHQDRGSKQAEQRARSPEFHTDRTTSVMEPLDTDTSCHGCRQTDGYKPPGTGTALHDGSDNPQQQAVQTDMPPAIVQQCVTDQTPSWIRRERTQRQGPHPQQRRCMTWCLHPQLKHEHRPDQGHEGGRHRITPNVSTQTAQDLHACPPC